jgi:hypothetical protein
MLRRASIAVAAAGGSLLLAGAPVARADDAAVQQVVMTQEKKIAPDNKKLQSAIAHVSKSNAGKAKTAITKVTSDITGYRTALLKVQGSSADVTKGRKALLSALSEQRSGLSKLKTAVTKYQGGESEASVKKSVTAAVKKLSQGQKDAVKAAKLLGITG